MQAPVQNGVVIEAAQVSADDEVTINVCNLSGTTMSAIGNLPIRVVTFG